MRFVNWLQNAQSSGGSESGAYAIGNGTNVVRHPFAKYFLPTENEWYKAAYYDPAGSDYHDYPTGTDTEPYSDNPNSLGTPDNSNVANFLKDDFTANGYNDGYAVTGSPNFPKGDFYTDVGAYTLAASPYGTFDQGGNAWEWTEAVAQVGFRYVRGGSWANGSSNLRSNFRAVEHASLADYGTQGFRVAAVESIPEPNTAAITATAAVALLARCHRSPRAKRNP
jgi:formylglycine-generating enzyme required for sulfatase activity